MKLGDKILELRKQNNLNREELGKTVGTSGAMIGKYERNEMMPSVEMAKKIAEALKVSLDYLAGSSSFTIKDKEMMERLENIETLSNDDRVKIFNYMDLIIRDAKARQAYAR